MYIYIGLTRSAHRHLRTINKQNGTILVGHRD